MTSLKHHSLTLVAATSCNVANALRRSTATSLLIVASLWAPAHAQVISTVAGGGAPDGYAAVGTTVPVANIGFDGAGRLYAASTYRLLMVSPEGVLNTAVGDASQTGSPLMVSPAIEIGRNNTGFCFDANGNLFTTEQARIRKISPTGLVTTVAGTGARASSGDGGPATVAEVYFPSGIVCGKNGDLYFFDFRSIRKISANGVITTVARWTGGGYGGDGGSALVGNFFGPPQSMAVDQQGNIFVADSYNRRIRKIDANSGLLSTVAGNGSVGFSGDDGAATNAAINIPLSVAVDNVGNLYISDSQNHRIRRVSANGIITTIAGTGEKGFAGDGGPASAAILDLPAYLAISAAGELHFTDSEGRRIRKISTSGIVTTVMGGNLPYFGADGVGASNAVLGSASQPAIDRDGNLFVIDGYNVRKISAGGRISTVAGNGFMKFGLDDGSGDGAAATSVALAPRALAVDASGNLYIASQHRVRRVNPAGIISTFAGSSFPGFSGDGGPAANAALELPLALTFDPFGNLFIGSSGAIRKVNPAGIISTVAGNGVAGFSGDGGMATLARLTYPEGMAIDAQGNLFFADASSRIRKIGTDGIINTIADNDDGSPMPPNLLGVISGSVALDRDGFLYFTDSLNHRLKRISPAGAISIVAGSGESGFGGDGGAPATARLSQPRGVAIATNGDMYLADGLNARIRKISTRGGANYSDMWWAGSGENGWGMSIQQHASGVQFIALYVYDSAGQPRWYAMPGGNWSNNFTTYSGALYQPTSSPLNMYQSAAFSPGNAVGSATIQFADNRAADLSYVIGGVAGNKRMTRMNFYGDNPALDVGDMWWGGNSENGWGVSIAQQGGNLFSVWYTYGTDGKTQWFPMPGGSWNNKVYTGPLYATVGSPWLGAAYNPAAFAVGLAGTMSLNFSNPDTAIMNYTFTAGPFSGTNQSKAISRMAY